MNRIIKFRAWDKDKKEWDLQASSYGLFQIGNIERLEFNQSTGLPDRNGKEIYEGDILKTTIINGLRPIIGAMRWNANKAQFGVEAEVDYDLPATVEVKVSGKQDNYPEIIGNIYENPELLK